MTLTLLVLAGVAAVLDWLAVDQRRFRLEYLLKPLTLVLLIAAAASADLGAAGPWVVAALVFGLLGDIALLLADEATERPFLIGVGAFLVGHILYVVGFLRHGVRGIDLLAGLLIAAGLAGLTLAPVLRGAARAGGQQFATLVAVYAGLLALMTVFAVGTAAISTAIGGVLFLVSDTMLARQRFVAPLARGPLIVIATYHLAQFLIVVGLIRSL